MSGSLRGLRPKDVDAIAGADWCVGVPGSCSRTPPYGPPRADSGPGAALVVRELTGSPASGGPTQSGLVAMPLLRYTPSPRGDLI